LTSNAPIQTLLRFDYQISKGALAFMVVVAVAITAFFAYLAHSNEKGLRISSLLLSPALATCFYWALAAMGLLGTSAAAASTIGNWRSAGFVQLGPTEALLPRASLRAGLIKMPYASILRLEVQEIPGRQQMVIVRTADAEARLSSSGFKLPKDFARFLRVLKERTAPRDSTPSPAPPAAGPSR